MSAPFIPIIPKASPIQYSHYPHRTQAFLRSGIFMESLFYQCLLLLLLLLFIIISTRANSPHRFPSPCPCSNGNVNMGK